MKDNKKGSKKYSPEDWVALNKLFDIKSSIITNKFNEQKNQEDLFERFLKNGKKIDQKPIEEKSFEEEINAKAEAIIKKDIEFKKNKAISNFKKQSDTKNEKGRKQPKNNFNIQSLENMDNLFAKTKKKIELLQLTRNETKKMNNKYKINFQSSNEEYLSN